MIQHNSRGFDDFSSSHPPPKCNDQNHEHHHDPNQPSPGRARLYSRGTPVLNGKGSVIRRVVDAWRPPLRSTNHTCTTLGVRIPIPLRLFVSTYCCCCCCSQLRLQPKAVYLLLLIEFSAGLLASQSAKRQQQQQRQQTTVTWHHKTNDAIS